MTAEAAEQTAEIHGVSARLASVIVAGHTVEQALSFDMAETETVHGRPFDEELDSHTQLGMPRRGDPRVAARAEVDRLGQRQPSEGRSSVDVLANRTPNLIHL